jgi:hypothetical protein
MSERSGHRDEAPVASALGAIIAYDGVTQTELVEAPQMIQL